MVPSELGRIRGLLWLNGPRIRQETDDQLVYPQQNCLTARREGPLLSPKASSGRLDLWRFSVPLMSHSGRTLIFSLTPQKTENSGEDILAYSSVTPQSGSALTSFHAIVQSQTTVCGGGDRYNFHCLGSWFCYRVLQTHLIFNVFLARDIGRGLGQNDLSSVGFHPLET